LALLKGTAMPDETNAVQKPDPFRVLIDIQNLAPGLSMIDALSSDVIMDENRLGVTAF
jgi:hypothetical protein